MLLMRKDERGVEARDAQSNTRMTDPVSRTPVRAGVVGVDGTKVCRTEVTSPL